jgi:hypothetical protein
MRVEHYPSGASNTAQLHLSFSDGHLLFSSSPRFYARLVLFDGTPRFDSRLGYRSVSSNTADEATRIPDWAAATTALGSIAAL